jgi:hypothetical protein
LIEHPIRRAHEAEIDVLRGARSLEPKLDDEPTLQDHAVAEDGHHAREEAIEDEKLAATREVEAALRRGPKPLLEGLL